MKNLILNYVTLGIALIGAPLLGYFIVTRSQVDGFVIAGLVLMASSIVLLVAARLQLGSSFSISAQAHELVTRGLYAKIRHPIYFFGQCFILGIAIAAENLYVFFLWALVILMQVRRAKNEERVLEEKFGAAYREYRERTWF